MVRCRLVTIACLMLVAGLPGAAVAAPPPPLAAAAPPPPLAAAAPPAAAEADPLKPAFEALPDPDRRALQDALVWTDNFNGAVSGSYGPRTRDALLAHAKRAGLPPGTVLDEPARTKLLAEAETARRTVGFVPLRDPRAGLAIGVPLKLLPIRSTLPAGTRFAAPDGGMVVETSGAVAGPDGLNVTLTQLTRDVPGRRITYRLSKPDFVVVAAESATRKFYSRSALGVAPGGGSVVRGFTVSYPKAAADMDRLAMAVAATFDPFPAVEAPPAAVPQIAAPASVSVLAGNAVLVGPGLALTRADAAHCTDAEVGGAPARWLRQDPASGLALLALPGHGDGSPVAVSPMEVAARLALFLVSAAAPGAPAILSVAGVGGDASGRVRAPLQGADAGAVLVDDTGALIGMTKGRDIAGVMVGGGIIAETRYGVTGAGAIAAFLREASVPTAPAGTAAVTAGETAARWRSAILPLRCKAKPLPSATP